MVKSTLRVKSSTLCPAASSEDHRTGVDDGGLLGRHASQLVDGNVEVHVGAVVVVVVRVYVGLHHLHRAHITMSALIVEVTHVANVLMDNRSSALCGYAVTLRIWNGLGPQTCLY